MTISVSLTFDDGISAHAKIAAPLIEERGWLGAFNIITDFMLPDGLNAPSFTIEKQRVLNLADHPDKRMTWDEARELLRHGHEVYPHSCTHAQLADLAKTGKLNELRHEIADSRQAYIEHLGKNPKYFCCPHLAWTPEVLQIIRENKMTPFSNWRHGFGAHNIQDLENTLCRLYYEGRRHIDLMFHGIISREGGHDAFADEIQFTYFLDRLKALEISGKIRVVPYSSAHFFGENIINKTRRVLFRLVFGNHLENKAWR